MVRRLTSRHGRAPPASAIAASSPSARRPTSTSSTTTASAFGRPYVAYDLPAGGKRLLQKAHGYEATIVSGVVTYRDGAATGALPGQLVRGQREAQLMAAE